MKPCLVMGLCIWALTGAEISHAERYGEYPAANGAASAVRELNDGRIEVRLSDGSGVALPAELIAQLRLLPAAEDHGHLIEVLTAIVRQYAAHDGLLAAAIGRYAASRDPVRAGAIAQAVRQGNPRAASLLAENLPKRQDIGDIGAFLGAGLAGAALRAAPPQANESAEPRDAARVGIANSAGESEAAAIDVRMARAAGRPDSDDDRFGEGEPSFVRIRLDDERIRPQPRSLLSSAGLTIETPPRLAASPVQP